MKVSKLIELLQTADPDAVVNLHDYIEYGSDTPLFILWRQGDPKNVWIETRNDCDFPYQLACRFVEIESRDYDFYKDLLDRSITVDEVRKYISDTEAMLMEKFCKKHNLI